MSQASGGPDTPPRNRNNLPDLLREMPVTVSVKEKIVKLIRNVEQGDFQKAKPLTTETICPLDKCLNFF